MQLQTSSTYIRLLLGLFVALFVVIMYTFLHEGGHALIGLLFGETLTEFNIHFWDLSAHVDMVGGHLTQAQAAIQAAAGVCLPLLLWVVFIGLTPRCPSFLLRVLKLFFSLMVLNTLFAWMVLPVLYRFGSVPSSDDVTHFLQSSGMPPLLLTGSALALYVLGWVYYFSRIEGWKDELFLFRIKDRDAILSGTRSTLLVMTGILMFCVALAFLLNHMEAAATRDHVSPPDGFVPIAEIDLSSQEYSFEALARFSLDEPTRVGIFVHVQDITTSYFDLCVIGADGYSSVILHGENYSAHQDGGLWEENLLPGIYQVMLTSDPSSGTASVFLKTHSYEQ